VDGDVGDAPRSEGRPDAAEGQTTERPGGEQALLFLGRFRVLLLRLKRDGNDQDQQYGQQGCSFHRRLLCKKNPRRRNDEGGAGVV